MPRSLIFGGSLLLGLIQPGGVLAQERDDLTALATRLASITAVTGYEQALVDTVLRLLPGAVRDRAGNARLQLGGGAVRRLAVCPLDEPGYVVGGIRDDGYVTLRRVGRVPPLFDQQLEGHPVTIQGRRGPIPAVVAVRSIHLTRGREAPDEAAFTVDDAYVDVGAVSRATVAELGVRVLSPVTLTKRPHQYGSGLLAAATVGRRTACAALIEAVRQSAVRAKLIPRVTVAFVVEQQLSERGMSSLGSAPGPFDETLIVDGLPGIQGALQQTPDSATTSRWPRLGKVTRWSLPIRYGGTPVETVRLKDGESLRQALVKWIGGDQ
jgi:M42 glutamyl aminopeptidase